ncbi:hypothetical protein [Mycolicibacterium llatzerense]|uniref:hypothetical protein n=1 Tax=Mycolicibacterium llatzerense TaxID=280871 RepID=UPI0008DCC73F|nr:hypothetical protein [Mycolicibacterium llatzerense]
MATPTFPARDPRLQVVGILDVGDPPTHHTPPTMSAVMLFGQDLPGRPHLATWPFAAATDVRVVDLSELLLVKVAQMVAAGSAFGVSSGGRPIQLDQERHLCRPQLSE